MQERNEVSRSTAILASIVLNALNSLGGGKTPPVEPNNLLPFPQLEELANPYLKSVSRKTRLWILNNSEEIPPPMLRMLMGDKELWAAVLMAKKC